MSHLDDLASVGAIAEDEPRDPDAAPPSGSATCLNCGTVLAGRYCAACGQLDQPLRIPLHRFLVQSFTEFFGLDGRVWTTLGVLVAKPGKLTQAYLSGHRRRYLRPLRVYLSSTLLFFFLLSLLDPVGRIEGAINDRPALLDSTVTAGAYLAHLDERLAEEDTETEVQRRLVHSLRTGLDSVRTALDVAVAAADSARIDALGDDVDDLEEDLEDELDDLEDMTGSTDDRRLAWQREQVAAFPADSLIRPLDLSQASELVVNGGSGMNIDGPDWLTRARAVERLQSARTSEQRAAAGLDLARASIAKIPVVLFLMLPVFALILKLLYVRRGWYYSEHLVLGLHTHAFTFLVFTVIALLLAAAPDRGWNGWVGTAANVLVLGLPVYYLLTLKRVYGQGWVQTALKTAVLMSVYASTLLIGGVLIALALALYSS